MATSFVAMGMQDDGLDHYVSLPVAEPVDGDPRHTLRARYANDALATRAGVWTSTVGAWKVSIKGYMEFCVLLEGKVEVTESDGTKHLLQAGDSLVMEDGFEGIWTVIAPAKKHYFIVNADAA